KRFIILVALLCAACGGEKPESETTTLPASPPPPRTETHAGTGGIIPSPPPVAVHKPNRSTPQKCAGDGSYEQALDCFRISSGFAFVLENAQGVQAQGKMTRSTPGMERVQFKAADGISWTGEAKKAGVVWSRNGKHELSPPDITNRVWQRTTMVLDPMKKEGTPQPAFEKAGGETLNHYHFTNANSGEVNDVWVSATDGSITKWTAGDSTLRLQ
ncbi:MAG TPA: hypothetical protein VHX14_18955, partial [Thermoanaerobaculia bacterium]|nr:hypothetical protein [Thermoanaerobaculia bacterium]